ncbi:MAG: Hint domain-containing protein, partial [Lachnospiraceae bacterium]|nr:Hint domain-containing protein [Lachnospiraceae bacterium]
FENQETKEKIEITCTPSHRFFIQNKGWTSAEKLLPNDQCLSAKGLPITFISWNSIPEKLYVYNFEVEHLHTYFVGNSKVNSAFVHNECNNQNQTYTFDSVIEINRALKANFNNAKYESYRVLVVCRPIEGLPEYQKRFQNLKIGMHGYFMIQGKVRTTEKYENVTSVSWHPETFKKGSDVQIPARIWINDPRDIGVDPAILEQKLNIVNFDTKRTNLPMIYCASKYSAKDKRNTSFVNKLLFRISVDAIERGIGVDMGEDIGDFGFNGHKPPQREKITSSQNRTMGPTTYSLYDRNCLGYTHHILVKTGGDTGCDLLYLFEITNQIAGKGQYKWIEEE